MASENIFSALAKYSSPADENYLTEAFVFVMNFLLKREHSVGLEFLARLCANENDFTFDEDEIISISTQVAIGEGILDIEVSSPSKLIYIEVKDLASVDPSQLKRYKEHLNSSPTPFRRLILLTRFVADFSEHQDILDKHVLWSDVHDWLADVKNGVKDSEAAYLIDSFNSFLEEKQMSLQKVGWEYIDGVPALLNLMKMIEEVLTRESLRPSYRGAHEYMGCSCRDGEFWCGISYDEHRVLLFELQNTANFDIKALKASSSYPVERRMNNNIFFRLSLEDIHFFSLDKDKQLDEITKFVRTAYAQAQKMRIQQE